MQCLGLLELHATSFVEYIRNKTQALHHSAPIYYFFREWSASVLVCSLVCSSPSEFGSPLCATMIRVVFVGETSGGRSFAVA